MLSARVDLKGIREAQGVLRRLGSATVLPVLQAMGGRMKETTARSFADSRDPVTGTPWPVLSPATLSGRRGGSGKRLLDTTALMRSVGKPIIEGNTVRLESRLQYAALQQYGGVIKPRNAKNLAIPVTPEAKKAGSARRWMEQNKAKTGAKKGRFLFGSKGPYGIGRIRKDGSPDVQFVLKKSVTVGASPYLGFSPADRDFLPALLRAHFQRIARGAAA